MKTNHIDLDKAITDFLEDEIKTLEYRLFIYKVVIIILIIVIIGGIYVTR